MQPFISGVKWGVASGLALQSRGCAGLFLCSSSLAWDYKPRSGLYDLDVSGIC